jgi:hypothetical protein
MFYEELRKWHLKIKKENKKIENGAHLQSDFYILECSSWNQSLVTLRSSSSKSTPKISSWMVSFWSSSTVRSIIVASRNNHSKSKHASSTPGPFGRVPVWHSHPLLVTDPPHPHSQNVVTVGLSPSLRTVRVKRSFAVGCGASFCKSDGNRFRPIWGVSEWVNEWMSEWVNEWVSQAFARHERSSMTLYCMSSIISYVQYYDLPTEIIV